MDPISEHSAESAVGTGPGLVHFHPLLSSGPTTLKSLASPLEAKHTAARSARLGGSRAQYPILIVLQLKAALRSFCGALDGRHPGPRPGGGVGWSGGRLRPHDVCKTAWSLFAEWLGD